MVSFVRGASVLINGRFICIQSRSGYRGPNYIDHKGAQHILEPTAPDEALGAAVVDALKSSRWVLPESDTNDDTYPIELEFDSELYNYQLIAKRHTSWVKDMMCKYGYPTKSALFKGMKNCSVYSSEGCLTIAPLQHEKADMWTQPPELARHNIIVAADSSFAATGAALRQAFTCCT